MLILLAPAVSLLLPAMAVEIADAGGTGELARIAAAVAHFLLFYSGVFALIALTAAVGAGLLAADRIVLSPDARILAHAVHRTTSLIGICALANHIMLEVVASRAGVADSVLPFLAARSALFMGLGTLSSDIFVLVVLTGVLRRRFISGARPLLWRWLHLTAYAAWPMAVLHGLLAGRSAKPYVDWSYGTCLAAAALALTARYVLLHRVRTGATGGQPGPGSTSLSAPPGEPVAVLPEPHALAATISSVPPRPWPAALPPQRGPLRALPSPPESSWSGSARRPPRWTGAPWTAAEPDDDPGGSDGDHSGYGDHDAEAGEPYHWTAPPEGWHQ